MEPRGSREGFTLIELSIVLVIIGLIVGGILVGRDLVRAADIRAAVSQIEKYQTAVNAFKGKYGSLPGDMGSVNAASFGFVTRAGTLGHGDENGTLKGGANGTATSPACGENILFWNDLSTARLIAGTYVGTDTEATGACAIANPYTVFPLLPLADGSSVTVYSGGGINYYQLLGQGKAIDGVGGLSGYTAKLSPLVESMLDQKIDDGFPLTGNVKAINAQICTCGDPTPAVAAAPANGVCVSNATGNPYNTSPSTGGNTPACALSFRFQ